MKINLTGGDHTIFNSPGTEGTVDGVEAQCYGSSISVPPAYSKEHIQHYGDTMYSGATPVIDKTMDGQNSSIPSTPGGDTDYDEDGRDDVPAMGLGAITLPDQGDTRVKGTGKGNSNPTPAMPGA